MLTGNTQSFDYLIIGHITQDLVDGGALLGGTASYASLTAHALDQRTMLVTACPKWLRTPELESICTYRKYSQYATTFENIEQNDERRQFVHHTAAMIGPADIPQECLKSTVVHIGPVAGEISPAVLDLFPNAFIGITPQGWMREWKADGLVHYRDWPNAGKYLKRADAVILSIEDLQGNEEMILEYARATRVLAVTEGSDGARIYWNSDVHHIAAPKVQMCDATGAGDIFAAVFFIRLQATKNPWEAGELAVQLASQSVTRRGLASIPTEKEIRDAMVEVIKG